MEEKSLRRIAPSESLKYCTSRFVNLIDELKNDAAGLALLSDWLGTGEPVSKAMAESRAAVCLGCTLNKSPRWWEKAKGIIADTIRRQLELRNKMNLRLTLDDHLHMCGNCGCAVRLKCFTPIEHIARHTDVATFEKYPSFCWIKKEIDAARGQ